MQDYYNRRAKEYEEIYRRDDPARQAELAALGEAMRRALAGLDVLACAMWEWLNFSGKRQVLLISVSAFAKRLPCDAESAGNASR